MKLHRLYLCLGAAVALAHSTGYAVELSFRVSGGDAVPMPCRIHLWDDDGRAYHPATAPFWRGGFVCDGTATLQISPGRYHYAIERGPEWTAQTGTLHLSDTAHRVEGTLRRLANLPEEGWRGGDLHVHRAPQEFPLHLEAEDLSLASIQTWWNAKNLWGDLTPVNPVKESDQRYYDILSGEDERGGGALLYHRMQKVIDITGAKREFPVSTTYLRQAKQAGCWAEIEKPFWWDTPLWLSTGQIDSIGLAHNHMNRSQVLGNEAWGRPRDGTHYPGVHGNGLYTQDLYYKILNCGLRIPPSAGSASGVLPNPVGYNRVYVHTGDAFDWDRWWEGLRRGRSFVTNGPLLRLTANSEFSGAVFHSDGPLKVTLEGRIDSRDPIKALELVRNGVLTQIDIPATVTIEESGWFLVRATTRVTETFRFASTAPWYVEIGGKTMVPQRQAARFFLDWAKEREALVARALADDEERRVAGAEHAGAVAYWQKLTEASRLR